MSASTFLVPFPVRDDQSSATSPLSGRSQEWPNRSPRTLARKRVRPAGFSGTAAAADVFSSIAATLGGRVADLHVQTDASGTVRLTGRVSSYHAKQLATQAAMAAASTDSELQNHLTVGSPHC